MILPSKSIGYLSLSSTSAPSQETKQNTKKFHFSFAAVCHWTKLRCIWTYECPTGSCKGLTAVLTEHLNHILPYGALGLHRRENCREHRRVISGFHEEHVPDPGVELETSATFKPDERHHRVLEQTSCLQLPHLLHSNSHLTRRVHRRLTLRFSPVPLCSLFLLKLPLKHDPRAARELLHWRRRRRTSEAPTPDHTRPHGQTYSHSTESGDRERTATWLNPPHPRTRVPCVQLDELSEAEEMNEEARGFCWLFSWSYYRRRGEDFPTASDATKDSAICRVVCGITDIIS